MIMRTVALSLAAMLAFTGCMSDKDDDDANPPAGGWPQLEDGKLTGKICGLLTSAEYQELGHHKLLQVESMDEEGSSNSVSCWGGLGGRLVLDLQPTAESAKIRYDSELESHRRSVIVEKQATILADSVMQGADQSWFDYGPGPEGSTPNDYVLNLRRGALLASLALNNDEVKDPKQTIVRLAGLVLERIKDVGTTDAGTTPTVRLEVKGNGKASTIYYLTHDHASKSVDNVDLPWSIELPMADHGKREVPLDISATSSTAALPLHLSCSISVRGVVVKQAQGFGIAQCHTMSAVR
jgi:hypothetical protein